tara:strand:- start:246 stop:1169 length:924 start_codon:yes stop_codon:yes gene_type:complete
MIIINLGFPKTSTTNLQTHFYPNLIDIKYFGRNYKEKNSELFNELNDFIENRRKFSNTDLNILIQNFKNFCNDNKKILISHENWIVPYQRNKLTNKIEIVDQEVKLKNLLFILDKINISYKFFFIQRDLKNSIQSLFVTLNERIRLLFGEKFLSFDFFLDHINKKKDGYKDLLLLLDTYNLKKITKIISKDKIQLFNFENLLNDKEKFINDLSNYLEIEINDDLINKLSIFTRTTLKNKKGERQFKSKNKIFEFFKFLTPKVLINKFKFLLKIKLIRFFLFKNITVKKIDVRIEKDDILEKIINEYF